MNKRKTPAARQGSLLQDGDRRATGTSAPADSQQTQSVPGRLQESAGRGRVDAPSYGRSTTGRAFPRAESPAVGSPPEPVCVELDRETELLITWWEHSQKLLPAQPFRLRPGEHVGDLEGFYSALRRDVAGARTGQSPRARLGLLQADLARLRELFGRPPPA